MAKKKKQIPRKKQLNTAVLFNAAVAEFNNGMYDNAEKNLQKIILKKDTHSDARNLMGIIQCMKGDQHSAVRSFEKAISLNPLNPQYHNNLGIAFSDVGDHTAAIRQYELAISLNPDYSDAVYNLAISLNQTGFSEKAEKCYMTVIEKDPGHFKACNNLGSLLLKMGRPEEAIVYYHKALNVNPGFLEVYNNLGNAYQSMNKISESINCYKKLIELNPDIPDVYTNLGCTLAEAGEYDEASFWFYKGTRVDSMSLGCWQGLADTLRPASQIAEQPFYQELLTECLMKKGICKQNLSRTATYCIKEIFEKSGLKPCGYGDYTLVTEKIRTGIIFNTIGTSLIIHYLKTTFTTDPFMEKLLTDLRRILLDMVINGQIQKEVALKGVGFVSALASQCFLNNYVFYQSKTEAEQVEKIFKESVESDLFINPLSTFRTLLFATYHPLSRLIAPDDLPVLPDGPVTDLIRQQVTEPAREDCLKSGFESLCKITNETSQAVRDQYEENPYPRWLDLSHITPLPFSLRMKKIDDSMKNNRYGIPESPEVLIAGCGTGRQVMNAAAHFPDATITAVDLSRTSLAYAARKAGEVNIQNVRFLHGDILELGELKKRFDIIECAGVLHHMEEPLNGWKVLTRILNPGGFMQIGLYSEAARRNIVAVREFIRERGFTIDPEGIRKCRKELFEHPEGSVLHSVVYSKDFYTLSSCRDLIFHVREYRYTIPEISGILKELGLKFIGFEFDKQAGNMFTLFKNRFPEKGAASKLDLWQQFEEENPHSFSKMYQFWVQKI